MRADPTWTSSLGPSVVPGPAGVFLALPDPVCAPHAPSAAAAQTAAPAVSTVRRLGSCPRLMSAARRTEQGTGRGVVAHLPALLGRCRRLFGALPPARPRDH